MMRDPFVDVPVVFRYTRAQAIADGVLVDLSPWASETGFKVPVACTAELWNGYIVPPAAMKGWGQSELSRAVDVLWMLLMAIGQRPKTDESEELLFDVPFQQEPRKTVAVRFKAVCGPGDQREPVLTLMLPNQD